MTGTQDLGRKYTRRIQDVLFYQKVTKKSLKTEEKMEMCHTDTGEPRVK